MHAATLSLLTLFLYSQIIDELGFRAAIYYFVTKITKNFHTRVSNLDQQNLHTKQVKLKYLNVSFLLITICVLFNYKKKSIILLILV